ncbi:hypothetical protein KIPB_013211, partial [Kipferlia bialata]|eukprot:g13211.t1
MTGPTLTEIALRDHAPIDLDGAILTTSSLEIDDATEDFLLDGLEKVDRDCKSAYQSIIYPPSCSVFQAPEDSKCPALLLCSQGGRGRLALFRSLDSIDEDRASD